MKITITASTLEEAEFGLGCVRQIEEGKEKSGVVVRSIGAQLDWSMVAVVNKSPAGNYSAKVNQ